MNSSGKADPIIRQSTDHDIERLIFCPFDHRKMVSCGKRNIRLYRIRDQELRGGSVILPPAYQNVDFTDIAFDVGDGRPRSVCFLSFFFIETFNAFYVHHSHVIVILIRVTQEGRVLYGSTSDGKLYKIDYDMRKLLCVYQLHDTCINSVYVKEGMCVTGSDDKFVRLWPLDFTDFFLEAEHEGKIMSVSCSNDGLRVIVGSSNGSIGFLDVSTQKYQVSSPHIE
jgi:WD repeat-containing protein 90